MRRRDVFRSSPPSDMCQRIHQTRLFLMLEGFLKKTTVTVGVNTRATPNIGASMASQHLTIAIVAMSGTVLAARRGGHLHLQLPGKRLLRKLPCSSLTNAGTP